MSRFIIPRINCLVPEVYNERRRTIDCDHYPRIEAARQTLLNTTRPLRREEAAVTRRLRWARRHINFHLKPDTMSTNAFIKHSIIDCTCNWCLAYEDRMLVLTRLRSIHQRVIAANRRYQETWTAIDTSRRRSLAQLDALREQQRAAAEILRRQRNALRC